jgi:hypothetical protein
MRGPNLNKKLPVPERLNGRPPVSDKQVRFLREGYDAGFTTTQAAEMAGVHRNTAITYYRHFITADAMLAEAKSRLAVAFPLTGR